jgi:hypothetical protein
LSEPKSRYSDALIDYMTNVEANTCLEIAWVLRRSFQQVGAPTWSSVETGAGGTQSWTLSKQAGVWGAHVATTQPGDPFKNEPPSTDTEDYALSDTPRELPCKYMR